MARQKSGGYLTDEEIKRRNEASAAIFRKVREMVRYGADLSRARINVADPEKGTSITTRRTKTPTGEKESPSKKQSKNIKELKQQTGIGTIHTPAVHLPRERQAAIERAKKRAAKLNAKEREKKEAKLPNYKVVGGLSGNTTGSSVKQPQVGRYQDPSTRPPKKELTNATTFGAEPQKKTPKKTEEPKEFGSRFDAKGKRISAKKTKAIPSLDNLQGYINGLLFAIKQGFGEEATQARARSGTNTKIRQTDQEGSIRKKPKEVKTGQRFNYQNRIGDAAILQSANLNTTFNGLLDAFQLKYKKQQDPVNTPAKQEE